MPPDWAKIRGEFPALESWTFLNTATFGQLSRQAAEAMRRHLEHRDALACTDFLDWFADHDKLREAIAMLIQADADSIAFIANASVGLSLLLGGIDWKPGDNIVTLENEFPNNIYLPALLESRGVNLVETSWNRFHDSVNERTRLVAISLLSYVDGFRAPLAEIGKYLRERNVLFYIDGTQGLGALTLDVREVQPDLLAVHAYKWMLAPNGAGFMYVAPKVRRWLQPHVVGWRSHSGWRNVNHLHHGAPEFSDKAEKYEGGMLASTLLYALDESVRMMLEIGPANIESRVLMLAAKARAILAELGAELPAGDCYNSPIIAAKFAQADAAAIAAQLKSRGVIASARHGNLRLSTHFYNDESDLDRLNDQLKLVLPRH